MGSKPTERYERKARIVRVIDADTQEVDIDLGFDITVRKMLRVVGVNAPEMRGDSRAEGEAATAYAEIWFSEAVIEADDPRWPITIRSIDASDKYGRTLARVWRDDGRELARDLIDTDHGVLYKP